MSQPLINITRKQALCFAVFLVLYEFLTYIANDLIMPGMLQVVHGFHAPERNVAASLMLYVLGGASLQVILGPISDHLGRRPVMLFGAVWFFLFTTMIAFATNMHQFLVMRFFEGMGLCFIAVIGYAVLQEIFSEMDAVRLVALMTNVSVSAPLLGPLVGAFLIDHVSWQAIFLGIAALSLIALWGIWVYMPESVGQIKKDGEEIKRVKFSLKSMCSNYFQLFKNAPFILGSVSLGLLGVVCLAWIGLSPLILVNNAKLTLIQYGLWQVPIFGAFILANVALIKLTHVLSLRLLIQLGALFGLIGLVAVGLLPLYFGEDYIWLVPGIITYFFGYGLFASPMVRYLLFITPVSKGTASALFSMIFMSVQGLGIEIANKIYATTHSNFYFGLYAIFTGVAMLAVFFPTMWLRRKDDKRKVNVHIS